MTIKAPIPASTLIILSRHPDGGFATLLVKRAKTQKFMPSYYVFPGGVVENTDAEVCMRNRNTFRPDQGDKIDFRTACIRETFEETGILLTSERDDFFSTAHEPSELENWRTRVKQNAPDFHNLCTSERILPDIENMVLFSNIITPEIPNLRRYDTWFYISFLKSIPKARPDPAGETTECIWLRPQEALDRHAQTEGSFALAPPTIWVLYHLSRLQTLEQVKKHALSKTIEHYLPPFRRPPHKEKNSIRFMDCILIPHRVPDSRKRYFTVQPNCSL